MKRTVSTFLVFLFLLQFACAQDFGNLPNIEREKLLNDLEILYQALDQFHSGMYWYTPKDSVEAAFQEASMQIDRDLNVLEFHKLVAPLVALSREDHTNVYLPQTVFDQISSEALFMPLTVVFLGDELYCVKNGSNNRGSALEGKQIVSINGEAPVKVVDKIGSLFASDGYIKSVKFSDLEGFNFSKYYFYYYGQIDEFVLEFEEIEEPVRIDPLKIQTIRENLKSNYAPSKDGDSKRLLEYKILNDSTAYLGVHTFDNDDIKAFTEEKKLRVFLRNSFQSIAENNIQTLIVDVSENTGGSEGNEGLLYAYFGENYQKYERVSVKTQKAVLDNGIDKAIKLKAFGFFERLFTQTKLENGSLERRSNIGKGLMAYKKEPEYKFTGKTYVLISPDTYSGGSEFSNMMYSQSLATFVGRETGGGYFGNTSGYSEKLILPNSRIVVYIPALQFVMNVEPTLPFGRGVIPHYEVIPTFEEYINDENAALKYVLTVLENQN